MSETAQPDAVGRIDRPRWLAPLSFVLCLVGLAASIYLTYEHFTGSQTLLCSDKGAVNCLQVTTSRWSRFLGMPVSVLGTVFFVAMTVLCLPAVWKRSPRIVDHARLVAALGGLVMVFWLIYAEFFKVGAICMWCTAVHIVTFLLVIVLAVGSILTFETRN